MLTQKEILARIGPLLEREGKRYQKQKNVFARRARKGEVIATQTGDGLETTNEAGEEDYIVRNQTDAGEEYIVPAHKFRQKYTQRRAIDEAWHEYQSQGRILAVELTPERLTELDLPEEFAFLASWDEPMAAKAGDFLASPEDLSEVYRIARKEFFETYKALDKAG